MKSYTAYKILFLLTLLLSLQSCFTAREYARPTEVIQEDSFRTDKIAEDSVSMAELSWRELFNDSILQSHITAALEHNMDIRVAIQNINIAESYLKKGKAELLPSLSAELGMVHQELSATDQIQFGSSSLSQFNLSADLAWEADLWGKLTSNKKALQASYLRSVAGHQAVKTELISDLASLYFQLMALDKQLAITQQTVLNRRQSLETIRALKEAGNVTEVGVQQTAAQLYRAEAVAIDLKKEIRLLENTFSILLGEAPHTIRRGTIQNQEIRTELQTGVPLLLLRNRPDVMAAEYNLLTAFQLTNVARSNFYPSLRISASAGFRSIILSDLLNPNQFFASIAGSLAQPIFNRRQIKTHLEVAKAEQEIAFLNFRRSLLIASREVSDALYSLEAAEEKEQVKVRESKAYDLAAKYSEELLNSGYANYLEVLTARENFLSSQLELVNIRLNQLTAIVNLYQALGGGWR